MRCDHCSGTRDSKKKADGSDRLPRNWKRVGDEVLCKTCLHQLYSLYAITIPVVRPLGDGAKWEHFRESLRDTWGETTATTNWMMSQFYARDYIRQKDDTKMPKMEPMYLYPEARKRFPRMPTGTLTALEQSLKSKYMRKRYDILWTGDSSLPSARYPQPAIARGQDWRPRYEPAGKNGGDLVPCVSVPLVDGTRWLLQLRGGKEFRRQLRSFREIVEGRAIKGDLAILRRRADRSRNGVESRDNGGQKEFHRVMVKMVAWFPKTIRERSGAFVLSSALDALIIGIDSEGDRVWQINADHIGRAIASHSERLIRWQQDRKMGLELPRSRMDVDVRKHHDRMKTWRDQIVSAIVRRANRGRYATVLWVPPEETYHPWQWHEFKTALANKCNAEGLEYEEHVRANEKLATV